MKVELSSFMVGEAVKLKSVLVFGGLLGLCRCVFLKFKFYKRGLCAWGQIISTVQTIF